MLKHSEKADANEHSSVVNPCLGEQSSTRGLFKSVKDKNELEEGT